jgi:hypothetical protein
MKVKSLFLVFVLFMFFCESSSDSSNEGNDTTPPQILSLDPSDGAANVDHNRIFITVVFNEPMRDGHTVGLP